MACVAPTCCAISRGLRHVCVVIYHLVLRGVLTCGMFVVVVVVVVVVDCVGCIAVGYNVMV